MSLEVYVTYYESDESTILGPQAQEHTASSRPDPQVLQVLLKNAQNTQAERDEVQKHLENVIEKSEEQEELLEAALQRTRDDLQNARDDFQLAQDAKVELGNSESRS